MKRLFVLMLVLVLVFTVCLAESSLPTINDAVQDRNATGRVEVQNQIKTYSPYNSGDLDYSDIKIIILERRAGQKKYTGLDSGWPDNFTEGFPEGFTGTDKNKTHLYVRKDLMAKLDPVFRAKSVNGATWLLVLESMYEHTSTVTHTEYRYVDNKAMPSFDNVEDMQEWLESRDDQIESITYYPAFGCYSLVGVYMKKNKNYALVGGKMEPHSIQCKNQEASAKWDDIQRTAQLVSYLLGDNIDSAVVSSAIDNISGLSTFVSSGLKGLVSKKDYSTAAETAWSYLWDMAGDLRDIDGDSDNAGVYDMIIADMDYSALAAFVGFCNYSSIDRSMEDIEKSGDYMGKPDYQWMEDTVMSFISELNDAAKGHK